MEAIVLGCTELPLAIENRLLYGMPVIDPTAVLAQSLVRKVAPDRLKPFFLTARLALLGIE